MKRNTRASKRQAIAKKIEEKRVSQLVSQENIIDSIIQRHPELEQEVDLKPQNADKPEKQKAEKPQAELKTKQQRKEEKISREQQRQLKKKQHRKDWFKNHRKTQSGQVNFNRVMSRLWERLDGESRK